MKNSFEFSVSLQIRHPSLHPAVISSELGMSPKCSWAAGEPRRTPKGTRLDGVHEESYCSFDIGKGGDGELAACLMWAVDQLKVHHQFLEELRSVGGSARFLAFWYPNGDTGEAFKTDLLLAMAHLGIELDINVYDDRNAPVG